MQKALLSAVFAWVVVLPTAFAQSIYDNITPVPKVDTSVGSYYNGFSDHIGRIWRAVDPDYDGVITLAEFQANTMGAAQTICENDFASHTGHEFVSTTPAVTDLTEVSATSWRFDITCDFVFRYWDQGPNQWAQGTGTSPVHTLVISITTQSLCPAETYEQFGFCYPIIDILDNDTCPTGADYEILPRAGNDLSLGYTCVSKQDGSQCKYVPAEDGNFLVNDPEGTACYVDGWPTYDDNLLVQPDPPVGTCSDIGAEILACLEDPMNVCPNGQCTTGCGNFTLDGITNFICLSNDTDNDGIGDYADPDIDGDGIPNGQDTDADGDGVDDPNYSDPANAGTGTTNINVDIDEQAIVDGIVNGLTEQGDFEGTQTLQSIDDKISNTDSQIDALMTDSNFDLKNQISENGVQSSLSNATNLIAPTGCAASFAIPFTDGSIDLCDSMDKAKPFLWVLFAFGTFYYCYVRISNTVRSQT